MALEQHSKFGLNLELGESYIYGKVFKSDDSYSINIQQASNNPIVLPSDFNNIKESCEVLVSFGLSGHSHTKKRILPISMARYETFNKQYPRDSLWCISEIRK